MLVDKIRAAGVAVELRGVRECSATLAWGADAFLVNLRLLG